MPDVKTLIDVNMQILSGALSVMDVEPEHLSRLGYHKKSGEYVYYRKFENVIRARNPCIRTQEDEVILFSKMKNEEKMLSHWLKYYENLGVSMFVVIDNGSTDNTMSILMNHRSEKARIDILVDTRDFYETEPVWASELPRLYGSNRWCVNVDVDEFLGFPFPKFTHLINEMVCRRQYFLNTYLLDVYPREKLTKQKKVFEYESIEEYLESLYYDMNKKNKGKKNDRYEFNRLKFHDLMRATDVMGRTKLYIHKKFKNDIYRIKVSLFFMPKDMGFLMFSGFHGFIIDDIYQMNYVSDSDCVFKTKDGKTIFDLYYKKYIHGVLLHVNYYDVGRIKHKYLFKIRPGNVSFYHKGISRRVSLSDLPYLKLNTKKKYENDADKYTKKKMHKPNWKKLIHHYASKLTRSCV